MNLFALPTNIPWLSLIWLSLLVPAVALLFVPSEQRQTIRIIGTTGALVSLILTALVYGAYDSSNVVKLQFIEELQWLPQIGINYTLGVDGISLPLLLLTGIVIVASALVSWNIEERAREYWALLLLAAAGAYGVFMSVDLFLLFIFYELTLIPKFLLIGGWGKTRREYGATKLALYMMGGSALIVAGIIAIYFGSGLRTFDMRVLQQAALFPRAFQIGWFAPLFAGFAVLAGMVPFHTWAPTGHTAAPTAISMLLAGVMMKLGSYGCLRVGMTLLPEGALTWLLPIALLTLVGAVYGSLIAAAQRDFKFMIAYSSISHMALVLMGLAAGNAIGLQGAVLQMFAHGGHDGAAVRRCRAHGVRPNAHPRPARAWRAVWRDAVCRDRVHHRRAVVNGHAGTGGLLRGVQCVHGHVAALPAGRNHRRAGDSRHGGLHAAGNAVSVFRHVEEPGIQPLAEVDRARIYRRRVSGGHPDHQRHLPCVPDHAYPERRAASS